MTPDPHMQPSPSVPVDCHRIDLDLPRPAESDTWLSEQERARAARFRFPHLQERYRATRVALRSLLGQRLGIAPRDVRIVRDERGKPRLDPVHNSSLHFNLTHSEGVAWIAIAERPLGVDLEIIDRSVRLLDSLTPRVSAPAELEILHALPQPLQQNGFLLMWTRKEGLLKGWGLGISGMGSLARLDTRLPDATQLSAFFASRQLAPDANQPHELARLPLAHIMAPPTGNTAGKSPLYVSSHHLGTELLAIASDEAFQPTLHLDPPAPFTPSSARAASAPR